MIRWFAIILAVVILLISIGALAEEAAILMPEDLVGAWVYPDSSGYNLGLVFNEDGTCRYFIDVSAWFECIWKLKDNYLSITCPEMIEQLKASEVNELTEANDLTSTVLLEGTVHKKNGTLILTTCWGFEMVCFHWTDVPVPVPIKAGTEAEAMLGEWDLFIPSDSLDSVFSQMKMCFHEDGTATETVTTMDSMVSIHMLWSIQDGQLSLGEDIQGNNVRLYFDGETAIAVADIYITVYEESGQHMKSAGEAVYIFTRPDATLTEKEITELQQKYVTNQYVPIDYNSFFGIMDLTKAE